MAGTMTRRPLPALIGLLALLALTAIVWWRVANRDDPSAAGPPATPSPTCRSTAPVSRAATPVTVAPRSVTVQVLNSTDRGGIAASARQSLIKDGFRSPTVAGNDSPTTSITASAEVRYGSGSASGKAGAQLLGYYFPGSVLKAVSGSSSVVTVSLGDGYKSVASAAAVRTAIAGSSATPSPAASAPSC